MRDALTAYTPSLWVLDLGTAFDLHDLALINDDWRPTPLGLSVKQYLENADRPHTVASLNDSGRG